MALNGIKIGGREAIALLIAAVTVITLSVGLATTWGGFKVKLTGIEKDVKTIAELQRDVRERLSGIEQMIRYYDLSGERYINPTRRNQDLLEKHDYPPKE